MRDQRGSIRMASGVAIDDLTTRIADAMRILRDGVPVMSEQESQLLSDFARGRNLTTLCKLCGVSERAFREADALSVAEAIRGHVMARRRHRASGLLSVLDAFEQETASNGPADEAQLTFIIRPSRATKERCIETLARQEIASRQAIDALHTTDISHAARSLAQCS